VIGGGGFEVGYPTVGQNRRKSGVQLKEDRKLRGITYERAWEKPINLSNQKI